MVIPSRRLIPQSGSRPIALCKAQRNSPTTISPKSSPGLKNKIKWKMCARGYAIGRMYFVHPSAGERFYLRILLTIVKGAESWEDLRRFDNVLHPTFKVACQARGLLEDDSEWKQCLQEAALMQTGHQLRNLFAIILLWSYPNHPDQLWDQFKVNICDDLRPRLIAGGRLDPTDEDIFDYGLHLLNKMLIKSHKSFELNFPSMPTPQQQWDILHGNPILQDQLAYDAEAMTELANTHYQSFNAEQKHVFDTVMDSVRNDKGMLF